MFINRLITNRKSILNVSPKKDNHYENIISLVLFFYPVLFIANGLRCKNALVIISFNFVSFFRKLFFRAEPDRLITVKTTRHIITYCHNFQ